ncbi:hypothetical protein CABS03_10717, partial [Colletotrichum abscissum]
GLSATNTLFSHCFVQATRKTTSRHRVSTSSILKMEADRHNILAATPEAPRLRRERLSRFFGDKDGPITISVEPLDTSERRQRAQADIDGIFAGLAYLDKRRDSLDTADTNPQSEQPLRENLILNDIGHQSASQFTASASTGQVQHPQRSTENIRQAWTDLQSLQKGLKAQYERLGAIASKSSSEIVQKLPGIYGNSRGLGKMGILAHRDALDLIIPDTLAEIIAFASFSYVISEILLQRDRIVVTNPLSDLQRWGHCIPNINNREAFVSVALEMWPSDHPRTTTADAENGHSGSNQPYFGSPDTTNTMDEAYHFQETSYFFEAFSGFEEILASGPYGAPSAPEPSGVDPREVGYFSTNLSPDDVPLETFSAINGPPMPTLWASAEHGADLGPDIDIGGLNTAFPNITRESNYVDCNMQYTSMISAVLAFSQDIGDFFYRLSGCGKTVHGARRGSAYASERSKVERRLRKEMLDPMKKSGTGDEVCLAWLSVAKEFVVLGSLGTVEDVQEYLVTVSREVNEAGRENVRFRQWIHDFSSVRLSSTNAPNQSHEEIRQGRARSETHESQALSRQVHRCQVPTCTKTFATLSGLRKHDKGCHQENVPKVACLYPGCEYEHIRPDIVRGHWRRMHKTEKLHPGLEPRRRGPTIRTAPRL